MSSTSPSIPAVRQQNVLVPLKVDAFVFNAAVCEGGASTQDWAHRAKIAPITQPNYSFLRLNDEYLQSDILPPVDLHNAWPSERNSRFTDLGTRLPRERRQGVYLHWTIPRAYRSGVSASAADAADPGKGGKDEDKRNADAMPQFPEAPTRWLVVRHITDMDSIQPEAARKAMSPVTAWVVESDRAWELDGGNPAFLTPGEKRNWIPDYHDLQVDVAPFINAKPGKANVDSQGEVFIGEKKDLTDWTEEPLDLPADEKKGRVNLRLLGSSNELFPDYQPHCPNVFSMLDNFEYTKGKYATQVNAHYSVIGWHSAAAADLLQPKSDSTTRKSHLQALKMVVKGQPDPSKYPEDIKEWFAATPDPATPTPTNPSRVYEVPEPVTTRSLCHGVMYDVRWDAAAAPARIPADHFAKLLTATLPVAVGTTPMDALITYAGAHQDLESEEEIPRQVEKALKDLEKQLLARDDGVESRARAADMLYNWNYHRTSGGEKFHISDGGGPPKLSADRLKTLGDLNNAQRFLDAVERQLKHLRWYVFSEWWKTVTKSKEENKVSGAVGKLRDNIGSLESKRTELVKRIGELKKTPEAQTQTEDNTPPVAPGDFEPGVYTPFYQQQDPTLLVGGIRSGWEPDYLDSLNIRLDCQVVKDAKQDLPDDLSQGWNAILDDQTGLVSSRLPRELSVSAKYLLREFVLLRTRRDPPPPKPKDPEDDPDEECPDPEDPKSTLRSSDDDANPTPAELPVFHDMDGLDPITNSPVWRDAWNDTQPWFPLFLEWEVEYAHIKYEDWELAQKKPYFSEHETLHYGIKPSVDLETQYSSDRTDTRLVSGRALLLPQPSFSLEAKIQQLFRDTPPAELKHIMDCEQRAELRRNLKKLDFLSAPLSGFGNHMITAGQGNHVKPSIKDPSTGGLTFMKEAYRADAGLDEHTLPLMKLETDLTPYDNTTQAASATTALFKPVTHGQFRITKLNIIDKFGQAIHAVDPTPTPSPPKVWPCISEWYAPQGKGKDLREPNVVVGDDLNPTGSEYVQVPPQINQAARLNAAFAMPRGVAGMPFWRAANEWDQPIWGWVVANYANAGLQIFLPNGSFYREVRRAGPTDSQMSPEWLPFKEPDPAAAHGPEAQQLSRLVTALSNDAQYLDHFMTMITAATATQKPPPSAYAEFRNALVGRPLALVNVAWSLELAGPAWKSQYENDAPAPKQLLPGGGIGGQYEFPIRIGAPDRDYDGLVGYFVPRTTPAVGDALDVTYMYSHFSPDAPPKPPASPTTSFKDASKIRPILDSELPLFSAYYISPHATSDAEAYASDTDAALQVFGALLDPFLPCHAYSGILPVKELSLPAWTWQSSMSRMSAFFHAGPVLVTRAEPAFNPDKELVQGQLPPKIVGKDGKGDAGVALPGGEMAQWSWLQPYMDESPPTPPGPPGTTPPRERYMAVAIEVADETARLQPGPYTALEGYLHMAPAPDKVKKTPERGAGGVDEGRL